jgi:hypothetical protein
MLTFTFLSGVVWGIVILQASNVYHSNRRVPVIGQFDAPGLLEEA